jgi:hypothetical protein
MEYHQDRFVDASLLIWDSQKLLTILPAHREDSSLVSHKGLTYGGFVFDESIKTPRMLDVFTEVLMFLQAEGFAGLFYKPIPHIYTRSPSQEDLYALYYCGAEIIKRQLLLAVGPQHLPFQERRIRKIKQARKLGLQVRESPHLKDFWSLLETVLSENHDARPVHSLEEILLLQSRFPNNIRLFGCFDGLEMLAGILIYETPQVARAQYIAAGAQGRETGALDLIVDVLLNEVYRTKPYFDFGQSHRDDDTLNIGLIDQKEGFGARAVMLDQYYVDLRDWKADTLQRIKT